MLGDRTKCIRHGCRADIWARRRNEVERGRSVIRISDVFKSAQRPILPSWISQPGMQPGLRSPPQPPPLCHPRAVRDVFVDGKADNSRSRRVANLIMIALRELQDSRESAVLALLQQSDPQGRPLAVLAQRSLPALSTS